MTDARGSITPAFDVFLSHAHADAEWVRVLAENLHQSGLHVFFDEWEIGPGDVLVHRLDQGILQSRHGVLVVSPAALERPWVAAEYAALMTRAVEGRQRLVPVLLQDAEMPPLLAARVWVDFRHADGSAYRQQVERLVAELQGTRRGPPPRTGELKPPPGTGYRAEGAIQRRLRLAPHEVAFLGDGVAVTHRPAGLTPAAEQLRWQLEQARRGSGSEGSDLRAPAAASEGPLDNEPALHVRALAMGAALGNAFLDGDASKALAADLAQAERLNVPLELGLEIDESLAALPWETLQLPPTDGRSGMPLALHPRVQLYRSITDLGATPAVNIPGPLRVLVAIGSPEVQNARGELLDLERELSLILDAVEPARRRGRAFVRILETGSVAAIRETLSAQRYHVLHISCHAAPGLLVLEDEHGAEDRVDADRLWRDALVPNRGVPLVVLSGCATALPGAENLASLARALLVHGVPAVLAMQAPVSDAYASSLGAALYGALATHATPDPLTAFCEARRAIEASRRVASEPALRSRLAEWATPTLLLRGQSLPLFDPSGAVEALELPPEPRLAPGIVVRRVGDFVGRRREQRLLLRALRAADGAGVLIQGIGGVGKSTLAAQVLHRLAADDWLVASVFGRQSAGSVLEALGDRLFSWCIHQGRDERDPLREVAVRLKRPDLEWEARAQLLAEHVSSRRPVALLLDNFEDNLDGEHHLVDAELAELLAGWLQAPGDGRLVTMPVA